ncbi:hypothetical protein K502DRAFT_326022 [Neoconidiobolus thromboides FSU 785]|nr:hypothetical protein K502DRAFT_326022 [Neoconidiobolus thromboides FSU 785]
MYSKLVQLIRTKNSQNEDGLFKIFGNALSQIIDSDYKDFDEHMLGCLARCMKKEELLD